jgi:hypothetical protein
MLTDERRAEIESQIEEWRHREEMYAGTAREVVQELLWAIDRMNEIRTSRSELAATTIAGLEKDVNRLRAVCEDKERHMDGWRKAADEDRARIRDLEAERDALMRLIVHGVSDHAYYLGLEAGPGKPFQNTPIKFTSRDSAVAAVRKAAGLDDQNPSQPESL